MRLPLALLGALFVSSIAVFADDDLPHVSVFGTATTQVEPDMLRWTIDIQNTSAEVEAVAFEHANTVATTLRFLKDQRIPADKTQTSQMRLSEHREYRNNSWVREGYDASTQISFVTTDLTTYRAIWHGLSKIKGISVRGAAWDTSKRIELQNSTRIDALKAAKTKAEVMAATLGMKLAEPLAIEEPADYSAEYERLSGNALLRDPGSGSLDNGEAISPGVIDVRARVSVVFRLVAQ